jgi:hypothetical protein
MCSIAQLSQLGSNVAAEKHRLSMDEKWSVSLDRRFIIRNPAMHMRRADLGITVAFDPWWIPWRRQKTFAFRSEKDREGKLYWRSYPLDD